MSTPLDTLREKTERLPTSPGCYLMKDQDGVVIYVGKAINLRARVRQYMNLTDGRYSVKFLMQRVVEIDVALARDEREALLLENSLIKKYRPRYNIKLRDDKTYLSARLDTNSAWPRLTLVRRPRPDGARYFGPWTSSGVIRDALELIEHHFPLRTCEDRELNSRTRPCLQYQIKRCLAPCVNYVDTATYQQVVDQVVLVLEGKEKELEERLEADMMARAMAEQYEDAARLRDRIKALQKLTSRQQMVSMGFEDRDILGFHREGDELVMVVVPVRRGKMQDNHTYHFKDMAGEDGELLSSFIGLYYGEDDFVPAEIFCPFEFPEREVMEQILSERSPRKVHLKVPQRGEKTRLVALAQQTAEVFLQRELDHTRRWEKAAEELQKILSLPKPPETLECFDISNFHGKQPVASKVRFRAGAPEKAGYRHFKIKTLEEKPNDFAMMKEVLTRRFTRAIEEGDAPDVLVVDGGKGQLGVAVAVLEELGLSSRQVVMGFAKPDDITARGGKPILIDKIFLPGRKNPVVLANYSPALRVLQHLRDESHRFAITFHRHLRDKKTLTSVVDAIPGIGPRRRTALLKAFGSVRGLSQATVEDIAAVDTFGEVLAAQIFAHLHPPPHNTPAPTSPEQSDTPDLTDVYLEGGEGDEGGEAWKEEGDSEN